MTERECELIARRVADLVRPEEPWLSYEKLAEHYSCSVRSLVMAKKVGMPFQTIFGRPKFRLSQVDPWLREGGYFVDGGCTVISDSANGAATADTAPPHDREVSPDGQ